MQQEQELPSSPKPRDNQETTPPDDLKVFIKEYVEAWGKGHSDWVAEVSRKVHEIGYTKECLLYWVKEEISTIQWVPPEIYNSKRTVKQNYHDIYEDTRDTHHGFWESSMSGKLFFF